MKKAYDIKGFLVNPKLGMFPSNFMVFITSDKTGITLSIAHEDIDIQFTIPLDVIFKDLYMDIETMTRLIMKGGDHTDKDNSDNRSRKRDN